MPPKPGTKTGPKGPSNDVYYEDHQVSDNIIAATLRLEALKNAYVDRMEAAVRKQERNLGLKGVLEKTERDLAERVEEQQDVLADHIRQHKTDERGKISEIASLDADMNRLQEERLRLEREIADCEATFDKSIKERRAQIVAIAQRTAEMEKEFAVMLNDVQQSVEAA